MTKTNTVGGAQAPPRPLCTHRQGGEIKPVAIGKRTIYAGGGMYIKEEDKEGFDLIIDLRDERIPQEISFGERRGNHLYLPIRDFNIVPEESISVFGWELLQVYGELTAGKRVLVYCAGGHGRTGLFLASLLAMARPDLNPIMEIRDQYCFRAVETPAQEEQVARMHDAARAIHDTLKGG